MILIIMIIVIIFLIMMNTEKLEALEHLKSLIEVITNQEEPMVVLHEEIITIQNILVNEIDLKIYHQKNILI